MKLIDKYYIFVSKRDKFYPDIEFSIWNSNISSGLISFDLFGFFSKSEYFYQEKNLWNANSSMIDMINSILLGNEKEQIDFSNYESEKTIVTDKNYTYLEQWNICTRIPTIDFLNIFIEFKKFLERWFSKEKLLSEIGLAFEALKEQKNEKTRTFEYLTSEKDIIKIIVLEDQFKLSTSEYVNSLELPVHLQVLFDEKA